MRLVGRYEGLQSPTPELRLRRTNSVRTVHASLRIEGNTLTHDQITAVLAGRKVVGPPKEILEARNALKVYAKIRTLNPRREASLLAAHKLMMMGLADDAGKYRRGQVGIVHRNRVAHIGPPPGRVPGLMANLFQFLRVDESHELVKAAVFHYELEFIHPFSDGNGRMGRLWHHSLLLLLHDVFEHVPLETAISARQSEYYAVLAKCDAAGNSTAFVEFALDAVHSALAEFLGELRPARRTASDRLQRAKAHFRGAWFARKEYLRLQKGISSATASRDLAAGVESESLESRGTARMTRYRFR